MKTTLILVVLVLLVGGAGVYYWQYSAKPPLSFRTAQVQRGDLLSTISATGTVEPEEVVDVGAQIAGKIGMFGKDPHVEGKTIDYGTPVEVDTVLAHIDDALYAADVAQSKALVAQAKANVRRAEADLQQMQAKLVQAEQNWDRVKKLGPSAAVSATDYDSYKANYEVAKATVALGDASRVQAETAVLQAEATLERATTNLDYCTIRSPVRGVIIDRRVNIGQTVVASLNAPSLFLIAKDLKKMQVWASVNEMDIGNIHPRQPVLFTVDTYPGRRFRGEVGKVRLNATMTQNVVTYTVEVNTDNSDGKLLPYMTANVQFEVARRHEVLTVPNAALRWTPSPDRVAPEVRAEYLSHTRRKSSTTRPSAAGSRPAEAASTHGTVWIQDEEFARPVAVHTGLSDGTMTEIQSENLTEGAPVIVGESAQGSEEETKNPFAPRLFGGRRSG